MSANDTQIGGGHYKAPGHEEHWDRAWRLKYDCFQYIITKWVERWREKGGLEDLKKIRHAIDKYIEVNTPYCTCGGSEDGKHGKSCNIRAEEPLLPHQRITQEALDAAIKNDFGPGSSYVVED